MVYEYKDVDNPELYGIHVRDVYADDGEALSALWWTLGTSSTMSPGIRFVGAPSDPLQRLLPEFKLKLAETDLWMLRLVDAPGAIAQRGYARGLSLDVAFALRDPQLQENEGTWRLVVEGGAGRLERAAQADLTLDIGGLSSLYAGAARCRDLSDVGRLTGGSEEERASLDSAFAGETSFMLDMF